MEFVAEKFASVYNIKITCNELQFFFFDVCVCGKEVCCCITRIAW